MTIYGFFVTISSRKNRSIATMCSTFLLQYSLIFSRIQRTNLQKSIWFCKIEIRKMHHQTVIVCDAFEFSCLLIENLIFCKCNNLQVCFIKFSPSWINLHSRESLSKIICPDGLFYVKSVAKIYNKFVKKVVTSKNLNIDYTYNFYKSLKIRCIVYLKPFINILKI